MDIISRKEAKEQGLKYYFTGEPCPHGHVAERYVSNGRCVECTNDSARKWQKANPEKVKELRRAQRQNGYDQKWIEKNKDKVFKYKRRYREANKEKLKEFRRQYYQKKY